MGGRAKPGHDTFDCACTVHDRVHPARRRRRPTCPTCCAWCAASPSTNACCTRSSRPKPTSTPRCSAPSRAPTPCWRTQTSSAVGLALWYYTFSTFTGRPDMFLEDLFVEPAHRGQRHRPRAAAPSRAARAWRRHCRRIEWRVLNWNAALDRLLRTHRRHARCRTGTCGSWAATRCAALAEGADHG